MKIRNPWNFEYFRGDWSDSSSQWNRELLAEAEHEILQDGEYYMSIEDFKENFEVVTVA